MKTTFAKIQRSTIQPAPFQFSLQNLFFLITASSILLTVDQLIGTFATALLFGIFILLLIISILRLENPFVSGLLGFGLATIILVLATLFAVFLDQLSHPATYFASWLIYPMFGYTLGCIGSAFNSFRYD